MGGNVVVWREENEDIHLLKIAKPLQTIVCQRFEKLVTPAGF